ncbi:MAG: hypothetical protein HEEMFOPI_01167 [Holosporales bacterium]
MKRKKIALTLSTLFLCSFGKAFPSERYRDTDRRFYQEEQDRRYYREEQEKRLLSELNARFKSALDRDGRSLTKIIKSCLDKISESNMKIFFKFIQKNIGEEFLYSIFMNLDYNGDFASYFSDFYPDSNSIPERPVRSRISSDFYINLIRDFAQRGMAENELNDFKAIIKDNVDDSLWNTVETSLINVQEKRLKDMYRKALLQDAKGKMFLSIMQKSFETFSKNKMKRVLDVIYKKFGKDVLFGIYAYFDREELTPYFEGYFADVKDITTPPNLINFNSKFYVDFMNELSKGKIKEDDLQKMKTFIKDVIGEEKWNKIDSLLSDALPLEQRNASNIWVDSIAINLKKLLMTRPVVEQVAYQFLKDFASTYLSLKGSSDALNNVLLTTRTKKETFHYALGQLLTSYQNTLGSSGYREVLDGITKTVNSVLNKDYPRTAKRYFQMYQTQIANNAHLLGQVNNGFRANIAKSVADYQAVIDKNKVTFNSDVFCLMLIQVIATLENQLETTSNMPKNLAEYKQQVEQALDDVTAKFGINTTLDGVKKSVTSGLDSLLQETDTKVLFGLIFYQLLDQFSFSDQQKMAMLTSVQKMFESENQSMEDLKQQIITYQNFRTENLKFVTEFLRVDSSKLLSPFNAPNQTEEAQKNAAPNEKLSGGLTNVFSKLLSGLIK